MAEVKYGEAHEEDAREPQAQQGELPDFLPVRSSYLRECHFFPSAPSRARTLVSFLIGRRRAKSKG